MGGKPWSDEDVELVRKLARRGIPRRRIIEQLPGRSKGSVQRLLQRLGFVTSAGSRNRKTVGMLSFHVPVDVWGDRDRRINEYRTRAQELLGDPPPSQSALGRPCE